MKLSVPLFSRSDAALCLRVGMGLLFVIGGYSKLSQLLHPDFAERLVNNYVGTTGYINEVFLSFLFPGDSILTPWGFLTALSSFELLSGIALIAGLIVRPLALVYAFLLWTFVFSLPVVTTPGVDLDVKTYTSPAMFVQARDISLSGMMFVLYQLGSGKRSLDAAFIINANHSQHASWDNLGLLLRLSLALPLIIGAFFSSFDYIMTFATHSWILLIVAVLLISGIRVREAAAVTMLILLWYVSTKMSMDKSVIANLNGIKRELALWGGALVLFSLGGGTSYTPSDLLQRTRVALGYRAIAPTEVV